MKKEIFDFLVEYAFCLAICGLILLIAGHCDAAIWCGSIATISLCIAALIERKMK